MRLDVVCEGAHANVFFIAYSRTICTANEYSGSDEIYVLIVYCS